MVQCLKPQTKHYLIIKFLMSTPASNELDIAHPQECHLWPVEGSHEQSKNEQGWLNNTYNVY